MELVKKIHKSKKLTSAQTPEILLLEKSVDFSYPEPKTLFTSKTGWLTHDIDWKLWPKQGYGGKTT